MARSSETLERQRTRLDGPVRHELRLDLLDARAHAVRFLAEVLVLIVRRRVRRDGALAAALWRRRVALTGRLRARHVMLALGERVRQARLHSTREHRQVTEY